MVVYRSFLNINWEKDLHMAPLNYCLLITVILWFCLLTVYAEFQWVLNTEQNKITSKEVKDLVTS